VSREDIIRMAREAGAIHIHGKPNEFAIVGNDSIKAFAALVAAAEREACAVIAFNADTYIQAAAAIRARGQA
jgi:hypothetical protein